MYIWGYFLLTFTWGFLNSLVFLSSNNHEIDNRCKKIHIPMLVYPAIKAIYDDDLNIFKT